MALHDAGPGDAIELPEGIYSLAALTHCRAAGLEWLIWELAADEGAVPGDSTQSSAGDCPRCQSVTLALIQSRGAGVSPAWGVYRATLDEADALPDEPELTVEDTTYRLREQGEARGERATQDGRRDFWLGQYRYYDRDDGALIFMDIHGRIQRLSAQEMDERLVRVYQ